MNVSTPFFHFHSTETYVKDKHCKYTLWGITTILHDPWPAILACDMASTLSETGLLQVESDTLTVRMSC